MNVVYAVKCPKCNEKADSIMQEYGTCGTYREAFVNYVPRRIICTNCGFTKEYAAEQQYKIEYWYKTDFREHTLWAENLACLNHLIEYLSKNIHNKAVMNSIDRAVFEVLPKWMITNRKKVLEKLIQLRNK